MLCKGGVRKPVRRVVRKDVRPLRDSGRAKWITFIVYDRPVPTFEEAQALNDMTPAQRRAHAKAEMESLRAEAEQSKK